MTFRFNQMSQEARKHFLDCANRMLPPDSSLVYWVYKEMEMYTYLPEGDVRRARIGARSGFCNTRNGLLWPLRTHVTTNRFTKPPPLPFT
jgi:hypothetical protein